MSILNIWLLFCSIVRVRTSSFYPSILPSALVVDHEYFIRSALSRRYVHLLDRWPNETETAYTRLYEKTDNNYIFWHFKKMTANVFQIEPFFSDYYRFNFGLGLTSVGVNQSVKVMNLTGLSLKTQWTIIDNEDGTVSFQSTFAPDHFIFDTQDLSKSAAYGKLYTSIGKTNMSKFVIEQSCREFHRNYLKSKWPYNAQMRYSYDKEMTVNGQAPLGTKMTLHWAPGYSQQPNSTMALVRTCALKTIYGNIRALWDSTTLELGVKDTQIKSCEEAEVEAQKTQNGLSHTFRVDGVCFVVPFRTYSHGYMKTTAAQAVHYCRATYKNGRPAAIDTKRKLRALTKISNWRNRPSNVRPQHRMMFISSLVQNATAAVSTGTTNSSLFGWYWNTPTGNVSINSTEMMTMWRRFLDKQNGNSSVTSQRFLLAPMEADPAVNSVPATYWANAAPLCEFRWFSGILNSKWPNIRYFTTFLQLSVKSRRRESPDDEHNQTECFRLAKSQEFTRLAHIYSSHTLEILEEALGESENGSYWIGLRNIVNSDVSYWVDGPDDGLHNSYKSSARPDIKGIDTDATQETAMIENLAKNKILWDWSVVKDRPATQMGKCLLEKVVAGQRFKVHNGRRFTPSNPVPFEVPVRTRSEAHLCASDCQMEKGCFGYNLDKANSVCELLHVNQKFAGENGVDSDINWTYYERIDDLTDY